MRPLAQAIKRLGRRLWRRCAKVRAEERAHCHQKAREAGSYYTENIFSPIEQGWTWELQRFWNLPWATQYCFTLHSPHDEPEIKAYGMTPLEAVQNAIQKMRNVSQQE